MTLEGQTYIEICILWNKSKWNEHETKTETKQGLLNVFPSSKVTVDHITDIKITS